MHMIKCLFLFMPVLLQLLSLLVMRKQQAEQPEELLLNKEDL